MGDFIWKLLMTIIDKVPKSMRPSARSVVTLTVGLLLGGAIIMAYGQMILPSLRNELDSLHIQDSLLIHSDSVLNLQFAQMNSSITARTIYELSKSPLLSDEERAKILTASLRQQPINADSLQSIIMARELQQILRR